MIGSFRNNIPYNNFLLIVFGLLLKWQMFIHPPLPVVNQADPFLYRFLITDHIVFFQEYPFFASLISFMLILYQAIALNNLALQQKLFTKPNHLTAMTLVLFSAVFSAWQPLSGTMIASSFFVWVLSRLCKIGHLSHPGRSLFNIGMITGLATFFYLSSVFFILLIMLSLIILRPFRVSEWILVFMGIITPYYLICSLCYLNDISFKNLIPATGVGIPQILLNRYEWSALALILITCFAGFYYNQQNRRRLLVQSRKSWSIIFIFLFISIVISFLSKHPSFSNFYFILIPVALVSASAYHYPVRRWFPTISFWCIVALSIIAGYFFVGH